MLDRMTLQNIHAATSDLTIEQIDLPVLSRPQKTHTAQIECIQDVGVQWRCRPTITPVSCLSKAEVRPSHHCWNDGIIIPECEGSLSRLHAPLRMLQSKIPC